MERVDDLGVFGLKLIQNDDYFCFGCDSVELANFVTGFDSDKAIDLGAGNGIISVLLAGKKGIYTTAVEIDQDLCGLIERNVLLNGLKGRIDVLNLPIQNLKTVLKSGCMTIVVTNPPYFAKGSGAYKGGKKATARHELMITQKELIEAAAYLLNDGGRFYIVYPVGRLAELLSVCRAHKLEPKEMVLLYAEKKPPHLFLCKCVKNGKVGLKVDCRKIKDYGME